MTAIVTVQNVEKSFGPRRVLGGVSFAVHAGDRVGLVGINGSGKSTLLRLVADPDDAPDAGLITRMRGLDIDYVPQEPRLDLALTVGETLRSGLRALDAVLARLQALEAELPSLDGNKRTLALDEQALLHQRVDDLGGWDQDYEVRSLAAALSLPPSDRRVDQLSIGERRRVALARAIIGRPPLLALDEPTNHLDARTIEWLEARLAALPGALLLVTHDRYFLDRVATRILELDRGRLYSYDGNYSRFLEKQAERLENEESRERARASFVRREIEWIRRGPQARTTKQQARIDRFDAAVASAPTAADQRSGPLSLRLPTGGRLGKTILELRGAGKSLGGKRLFENLNLIFKPGDRIGVVGPNGAGKSTLVRCIVDGEPLDAGEIVVGLNTRIAYLDQARAELHDDRSVLEEVAGDGDHVVLEDGAVHVRTFLRMLLFDDGFAAAKVGTLSGGERNRVQLAKLLRAGGNLIVLDEPTNDLDLVTLGVLEEALANFGGCALVVSHDRWFLDKVATGILAFEGNGVVTFYEGDYSSYQRFGLVKRPSPDSPIQPKPKTARAQVDKPKKLTFKEKDELAGMEAAIEAAEKRVRELSDTLEDPNVYKTRAAEVPSLVAALEAARGEVERLYARWQELESLPR